MHADARRRIDLDDCATVLQHGGGDVLGGDVNTGDVQSDDIGCINGYICILGVDMIGNIHRGASGTEVVILPKIDDLTFFGHRIHGKPILF